LPGAVCFPSLGLARAVSGPQPMPRDRSAIDRLRLTIDTLPVPTRVAMLEGIDSGPIIVGAYVDRDGGVCPMLAAHRRGQRTDALSFARAWDHFSGARQARRATEREVRILRHQLQASLAAEDRVDIPAAIAEHRDLRARGETVDLAGAIAAHRELLDRRALREEHDPALAADDEVWSWLGLAGGAAAALVGV